MSECLCPLMMLLLLTSYSSPFSVHVNFPISWIPCNMSLALDFCEFVYGSTMSSISMADPGHTRKDDDDDGGGPELGFTL